MDNTIKTERILKGRIKCPVCGKDAPSQGFCPECGCLTDCRLFTGDSDKEKWLTFEEWSHKAFNFGRTEDIDSYNSIIEGREE